MVALVTHIPTISFYMQGLAHERECLYVVCLTYIVDPLPNSLCFWGWWSNNSKRLFLWYNFTNELVIRKACMQ